MWLLSFCAVYALRACVRASAGVRGRVRPRYLAVQIGSLGGRFLNTFPEGSRGDLATFLPHSHLMSMQQIDYIVGPRQCSQSFAAVLEAIDCDSDHRPLVSVVGDPQQDCLQHLRGARKTPL
eukprot:15440439-Alexandrium_andersonii.AAC.1